MSSSIETSASKSAAMFAAAKESMAASKSKRLKCFCNDDNVCIKDGLSADVDSQLAKELVANSFKQRDDHAYDSTQSAAEQIKKLKHCYTHTVCITKRLRRPDGSTWLKYYCDPSPIDSIRENVIEFRDCKINSTSNIDKKYVLESAEHCCNDADFCNLKLTPNISVIDRERYKSDKDLKGSGGKMDINKIDFNGSGQNSLFTPLNISLILSLFTLLLLAISLIAIILYKQNFKKWKKYYSSSSSSASSKSTGSSGTTSSSTTTNTPLNSKENSYFSENMNTINYEKMNRYIDYNKSGGIAVNEALMPFLNNNLEIPAVNFVDKKQSLIGDLNECHMKVPEKLNVDLLSNKASNQSMPHSPIVANFESTTSNMIKLSSPLSSTQSSGFIFTNSSESHGSSSNKNSGTEYEWSGSGSGAGVPQCVQRTIARQIKLIYPSIGKGRFGEVYKGEWRGELVAVKTFNSADEKSWENECKIYSTNGFRHENILGFIAADNIDRGTYTELWLITEYHKNGSLYDYLNMNSVSPQELLKMTLSIINGLVHLHMPIESCNGKPSLAHCDLKTKNILVKSDLSCCIGDLGLALTADKDGKVIHNGNIRTGTKRYMAPEILAKTIDTRLLVAFQKAEMYSVALIMWELLRRVRLEGVPVIEYKLPYYEYTPLDPDEIQMRQIVCEQKLRPPISLQWKNDWITSEITRIMEELWVENPEGRLNALRVKKSLSKINNYSSLSS
jgi:TGF-beta receptor type-1